MAKPILCMTAALFFWSMNSASAEDEKGKKKVFARITDVSGSVMITRDKQELPALKGMVCYQGDTIEVKKNSFAEIKLVCGSDSHVFVRPETMFSFASRKGSGAAAGRVILTLQKGALRARVKAGEGQSGFEIQTPVLLAWAWGTDFIVRMITVKETRVRVLEGTVSVSMVPETMGKYLGPQMLLLEDGRQIAVHEDIGFCSVQEIPKDLIQKMKETRGVVDDGLVRIQPDTEAVIQDTSTGEKVAVGDQGTESGKTTGVVQPQEETKRSETSETRLDEKERETSDFSESIAVPADPVDRGDSSLITNDRPPSPGTEIGGTVIPVADTMEAVVDSVDTVEVVDDNSEMIEHEDGLLSDTVFDQVIGHVTGTGGGESEDTDGNETSDEQFRLDEVNEERRVPEPPARPGN